MTIDSLASEADSSIPKLSDDKKDREYSGQSEKETKPTIYEERRIRIRKNQDPLSKYMRVSL